VISLALYTLPVLLSPWLCIYNLRWRIAQRVTIKPERVKCHVRDFMHSRDWWRRTEIDSQSNSQGRTRTMPELGHLILGCNDRYKRCSDAMHMRHPGMRFASSGHCEWTTRRWLIAHDWPWRPAPWRRDPSTTRQQISELGSKAFTRISFCYLAINYHKWRIEAV
jgi:hypothetical protein